MNPKMLPPFYEVFNHYKPKRICEIGTHDGKSAIQFVDHCLTIHPDLEYTGYDIFDEVRNDTQFHEREVNGKGAGRISTARNNLRHRQRKHKQFMFNLIRGYTQDTLEEQEFDFVYIDGGHSYDTVKHDYEKLSKSTVIVFDDYQTEEVKQFFDELVKEKSIPEVAWDEVFTTDIPRWSFMPHKTSKHVQPVIFNA